MVASALLAGRLIADCGEEAVAVQRVAASSDRCSLPVFSCADRTYAIGDVIAFGRWHRNATSGAPAPQARTEHQRADEVSEDALGLILADFRYDRDLVSAAECDAWLAQRGLCYADLVDSLRRQGAAAALVREREVDYLLSAEFADDACLLARHLCAAITNELALPPPGEPFEPRLAACTCAYTQALAAVLQADVRNQRLRVLQRSLSQIEFVCAEFDSLDAANEARLCVQHDGLTLTQLAGEHGFVCTRTQQRRECIPSAWQIALDGATAGRLALPIKDLPRYLVLQPLRAVAAKLNDSAVAKRIDATLLDEYFQPLLAKHIRWEIGLEAASD